MGCHHSSVSDKEVPDVDLSIKKDRHCTDILCLLFFILFFIAFLAVGILGLVKGDAYRLIYATDYKGQTCGTDGRGAYAYYPRLNEDFAIALQKAGTTSISNLDLTSIELYGICVSSCPVAGDIVCNYGYTSTTINYAAKCGNSISKALNSDLCSNCWSTPLDSASTLYRCIWQEAQNVAESVYCINPLSPSDPSASGYISPTSADCITKSVVTLTTTKEAAQTNPVATSVATYSALVSGIIGDIVAVRIPVLVCGFAVAIVMGFIYLILLQLFGGCIVSFTLWGACIGSFVITAFCFAKAGILTSANVASALNTLQAKANVTVVNTAAALASVSNNTSFTTLTNNVTVSDSNRTTWEIAAFVMLVLSILLLIFTVAFNKKIKIAVGVLKEASSAIQDVPIVLITPLFTLTLTLGLFAWFVVTEASIKTMGTITVSGIQSQLHTNITVPATFSANSANEYLVWFNLFGFLWVLNFIQGIGMMVVAGVIGEWYYTRPDSNGSSMKHLPRSVCCASLARVFRYHLGSVAFGSFIIAVVQFIRAVLAYIDDHTRSLQQSNIVIKVFMKIVQCCMWCFEKCIKFISFNAYVIVALRGKSFIPASCSAVKLILGEILTIGVLNVVVAFMMILGKLLITAGCMIVMYLWLQYIPPLYPLNSAIAPIVFVGVIAYSIARNFLSIYGMAIDTIMLCYCEDMSVNKKDISRAYLGKPLRKALGVDTTVTKEVTVEKEGVHTSAVKVHTPSNVKVSPTIAHTEGEDML